MQVKLAIITTEFLKDFLYNSLREIRLDIDYELYFYGSFADLPEIYGSLPDRIQGVITSGGFPAQIIKRSFPETNRTIRAFNTDDAGIYKLFLQLMKDRKLDLSRVYADLLEVIGLDVADYLFKPQKTTYLEMLDAQIGGMPLKQLVEMEQYCLNKHLALWEERKIDVSITRFSSIADRLKDAGIPCYFAYPSLEYLKNICENAVQDIKIHQLQQNLLAVIDITVMIQENSMQKKLEELRNKLIQFNHENLLDFILQQIPYGFEIYTSRKTVELLTDYYKACQLDDFLRQNLAFDVCIGYGMGNSMYHARINAIDANRESKNQIDSVSCLINEKDQLITPLCGPGRMVIPRDLSPSIQSAARRSGLSTLTIQKIFTAVDRLEGHLITSKELARRLSITQRSANRFLSAMVKADLAKVVTEKSGTTKGRPERVYQINVLLHE